MLHTAFFIDRHSNKDWLVQQLMQGGLIQFNPPLNTLNGQVFSTKTLQQFVDDEIRHGHFKMMAGINNTLTLSSSGEQRKAMLAYLIASEPDFIILDSVFSSLDTSNQQSVLATLTRLSEKVLLIQLFSRKDELLPFIHNIICVQENQLKAHHNRESFFGFLKQQDNHFFNCKIPAAYKKYGLPEGPLVIMKEVSVQFNGRSVLNGINWVIYAGEFWQLKGPNGSGKTTILSLITGNSVKGYGQHLILFGIAKGSGETVWDLKDKIGYFTPLMTLQFVRQDSIEQMILSGFFDSVGLYIQPTETQIKLALDWLMLIGMYDDKHLPFRMFPEGHQRMVLIARAMVKHPPLLILDEPTVGLDDEMAALFISLIHKIKAETNTAIIYVSHLDEAGLMPDKVFELLPSPEGSTGICH